MSDLLNYSGKNCSTIKREERDLGVNVNDIGDADTGPNEKQNYPVAYDVDLAGSGSINLSFYLDSLVASDYRIEFYRNINPDASGHGEGQEFLSAFNISHSGSGVESFTANVTGSSAISTGDQVSMTATVIKPANASGFGSTSEFSPNVIVESLGPDFGDAPDTGLGTGAGNYNTLLTDNGPYHIIGDLYLGQCVDADSGSHQDAAAEADDTSITTPRQGAVCGDDEDGVYFPTLTWGSSPSINVIVNDEANGVNDGVSANAIVDVWIDLNVNGSFEDAGEHIVQSQAVTEGANQTDQVSVSGSLLSGGAGATVTYARVRLASSVSDYPDNPARPLGEALIGEVEDYQVTILDPGTASIGDMVTDENGTGLEGVIVKLYLDNGDGIADLGGADSLITSQATVAGLYDFTMLPAGSYWVSIETTQASLINYGQFAGASLPQLVSLIAAQDYNDADYAFKLNHAPTEIQINGSSSSISTTTGQSSGSTIGVLSSTDPDTGDTHTYSLGCSTPGADDALFQIVNGNELQLATTLTTPGTYQICVVTTDSGAGSLTYEQTISITVTASSSNTDTDGDGLLDSEEGRLGTDPSVKDHTVQGSGGLGCGRMIESSSQEDQINGGLSFLILFLLFSFLRSIRFSTRLLKTSLSFSIVLLTISSYGLDVQMFKPRLGQGITVDSAGATRRGQFQFNTYITTARNPLEFGYSSSKNRSDGIVDNLSTLNLGLGYSFGKKFIFSLDIPFHFRNLIEPISSDQRKTFTQLGDLIVRGKFIVRDHSQGKTGFAISPYFSAPMDDTTYHTSDADLIEDFMGVAGIDFIMDRWIKPNHYLSFNFGYRARKEEAILNLVVDDELVLKASYLWRLNAKKQLDIFVEMNNSTTFQKFYSEEITTPLNILLAMNKSFDDQRFLFTFGGESGLTRGYGSQDWRLFVGIKFRN